MYEQAKLLLHAVHVFWLLQFLILSCSSAYPCLILVIDFWCVRLQALQCSSCFNFLHVAAHFIKQLAHACLILLQVLSDTSLDL